MSWVEQRSALATFRKSMPQEASPIEQRIGTERPVAVDALRGLLLIVMAINHVPSDLHVLSDQTLGYVSGAEGFVFLSGLLAGSVYERRVRTRGLHDAARAALARALVIYGAHVSCVALIFLLVWAVIAVNGSPAPTLPLLFAERPLAALLAALSLFYQPGLLDILPLYCGVFVLFPALLAALRAGHTTSVLALSGLVWLGTNLFAPREAYVAGLINAGALNLTAWQLLFVVGIVLGHSRVRAAQLTLPGQCVVGLGALALLLAASRHGVIALIPVSWLDALVNKPNLGPLRLLDSLLVFYLIALAVHWRAPWFEWRALAFLGRQSLVVFAAHVVVASLILALPSSCHASAVGRALYTSALLGSLFLAALCAQRSGSDRTPRAQATAGCGVARAVAPPTLQP